MLILLARVTVLSEIAAMGQGCRRGYRNANTGGDDDITDTCRCTGEAMTRLSVSVCQTVLR